MVIKSKILRNVLNLNLKAVQGATSKAAADARPMIYPYTFAAKASQFPFVYHFKQCWWFRYVVYAYFVTQPVWYFLQVTTNAPEYVAAIEAKKRADHEKEHIAHMWKDIEGKNANR